MTYSSIASNCKSTGTYNAEITYNYYYKQYGCSYKKKANSGIAAVAAVVVAAIVFIVIFTHCLKRRKDNGKFVWKCRKATSGCRCLKKRARSYEAHLERQLEKSRMGLGKDVSYINHTDTSFTMPT